MDTEINQDRINIFSNLLQKYLSHLSDLITIDYAILYGSYAKGDFKLWSDIDILIVSNDFQNKDFYNVRQLLFNPIIKYQLPKISPIGLSLDNYKNDKCSEFVRIVIKNGINLNLSLSYGKD